MKLYDIKNAETAFRKLVNADLPIKMCFKLSSVIDEIDLELKRFEDFRINLIKKYGTQDEKGYRLDDDKIHLFETEMNELLSTTIDIKPMEIPIDLLENTHFSVVEIKALSNLGFISDNNNKEK